MQAISTMASANHSGLLPSHSVKLSSHSFTRRILQKVIVLAAARVMHRMAGGVE
jgi:hypothetical protein